MNEHRIINLNINAVEMTQIAEATGCAQFWQALGYLVQWNQTFGVVDLFAIDPGGQHGAPELQAVYRKAHGEPIGYVIGAVWNPDSKQFGFHS